MNEINTPAAITAASLTLIQLVLLTLKATQVVNWGWEVILAPIWVPYALFIVSGIILIIYILIYNVTERAFKKHGR